MLESSKLKIFFCLRPLRRARDRAKNSSHHNFGSNNYLLLQLISRFKKFYDCGKAFFFIIFATALAHSQSVLFNPLSENKVFYVKRVRDFIKSDEFKILRDKFGDVIAVDLIYKKSLVICNYDIADALLVCGLSTLDHRKIKFKVPIIRLKLPIFLTSESEGEFKRRVENLPSHIFSDTLDDRDKLQHFFLSAYIAYVNGGKITADKIGILVEEGEKLGLNLVWDERDIMANRLGQEFGVQLHKNPFVLPSRFLGK